MSMTDVIQKCFSMLSWEWFENIKAEFYRHPYYVKEKGIISSSIVIEGEGEMAWDMALEHYFWDNSINEYWFQYFDPDQYHFPFGTAAKQLTKPILDELQNVISKLNSLNEKIIIIKSAIAGLYQEKLKSQIADESEYNWIIDYTTKKIIDIINLQYDEIFVLSGEIASYPDKIKLEINQNELAILVLLLCRSGIIDISKQPEKFAIDIISKNFLYKIEGTDEYGIPKNLNKQVSFFKPSHNPWQAPFDSLKNKIGFGFSDFK